MARGELEEFILKVNMMVIFRLSRRYFVKNDFLQRPYEKNK